MKERIILENVSKTFRIGFKKSQSFLSRGLDVLSGKERKKDLEALKAVSLKVNPGEIVGIIGENGSGKSTLLRCIAGIYSYSGKINVSGKVVPLINMNLGFQHRLTMKENIYLCCSLFGLSKKNVRDIFSSIVEFSELREFVNTKLYQFSNGMKQRLAFSIAIHCNPQILLLDEVFEVGDVPFREKSAKKIKELVKNRGVVVLVSHDLELVKKYCDKVVLIEKGIVKKEGNSKLVIKEYLK